MDVLITYDLDKRWDEVKQTAIQHGFQECAVDPADEILAKLPETTLILRDSPSVGHAASLFSLCVQVTALEKDEKINATRVFATRIMSDYVFSSDEAC